MEADPGLKTYINQTPAQMRPWWKQAPALKRFKGDPTLTFSPAARAAHYYSNFRVPPNLAQVEAGPGSKTYMKGTPA